MPYPHDVSRNPMNPADEISEGSEMSLWDLLDEICAYLWEGEAWHGKMANESRRMHVRGVGRWHEAEACDDYKSRVCIEKILCDKLHRYCTPDVDISSVYKMELKNMDAFKKHFGEWIQREERFIMVLSQALPLAATHDIELYKELMCLLDEVQNEKMRAQFFVDRVGMKDWDMHDLGVVSMEIHDYFENHYNGGKIDFNIG